MNNQQAINLLKGLEKNLDDYCELNDEGKTAFGMAITALELFGNSEQLPSIHPDTTTHGSIPAETGKNDGDGTSGDCISRQASLEKVRTMQTYKLFAGDDMILIDKAEVQTELMMLPSAQPEIIRCKDCKYWKDSDGVYRRGFDAESKCPLNLKEVYEGTFYCGMAERREDG